MDATSDWAAKRRAATAEHERRLRQKQHQQAVQASRMLERFTAAAHRNGLAAEPLRVQGYGGKGSARTSLAGWYLRIDRTCGVSEDGKFYVLTAPLTFFDRLRGMDPLPSEPPLIIGAGGPDGSAIPLPDALDRLLPGWNEPVGPA